ncbi:MAG: hypothetical protein KBC30_11555 [Planctomycetes bacterium]|jgi:ATP/ADP translocase|nr:hypothetical protein [Planctomycetota bacterium]
MEQKENILTKILKPITKVYVDEQPKAFFAFLAYVLLMASYYMIRPTRSSIFMKEWGTEWMPIFYLIIAGCVLVASFFYNFFVSLFKRTMLVRIIFGGVIGSFLIFWAIYTYVDLTPSLTKSLATAWYIWICVYILFLTSLFWSFNHDLHLPEQSRRLYPLILLGAQIGVVVGSWSTNYLLKKIGLHNYDLILASSLLLLCVWGVLEILRFFDTNQREKEEEEQTESKAETFKAGARALKDNLYALCIAGIVVFGTFSFTICDFQYKRMLERDILSPTEEIQVTDIENIEQMLQRISSNDIFTKELLQHCPNLAQTNNMQEICDNINNLLDKQDLFSQEAIQSLNISSRNIDILNRTENVRRYNKILFDNYFKDALNTKKSLLDRDSIERSAFLAKYDGYMGWLNIAILFLIAPFILQKFGPGVSVLFYPLVCLIAGAFFLMGMSIQLAAVFAVILSSLNYSLYLVGKETFYVPTDKNVRYKIKALIDTFGYRLGDATGGIVTTAYIALFGFSMISGLSIVLFIVAIPWLASIRYASKKYSEHSKNSAVTSA